MSGLNLHIVNHDDRNYIVRSTFNASVVSFILCSLTATIGSLIDGIIIGQFLNEESLAAFGLVSPIILVFTLIGSIIAAGSRNQFIMRLGKGDMDGARSVFSLSILAGIGLSALLMLAVFIFSNPICVALGAKDHAAILLGKTRGYLLGIAIGLPAMNAHRILSGYMNIDNDRRITVISTFVMTAVDIVLDIVAVRMGSGTFGMGLATSLSYYAALITVLTHFRRKNSLLHFSVSAIRWGDAAGMFSKGMPVGVGRASNTVRSVTLNRMLAVSATAGAIAAYSVHRQADAFLNPVIFGISDVVITLTGIMMGEENRPMFRRLTWKTIHMILTTVLTIAVVFWFAAPFFAALFIKGDPEALQYGIRAARCYAVGMPLYALNVAFSSYLEGRGNIKIVMFFNFLKEAGWLILGALMLFPAFGADAVWYAFPLAQIFQLMTIVLYTMVENRVKKLRPADLIEWFLALPEDFDVPEKDRIDQTITSHDEVIALSKAAWDFCDQHGCDGRRKYIISLAVEEFATNTVMTGFLPGHHNIIDMRILKKGDDYIVRIRDNCAIFDPVKQLQLYDHNVPAHHMGLRLAIETASSVQYTTILKLNNLVIRV